MYRYTVPDRPADTTMPATMYNCTIHIWWPEHIYAVYTSSNLVMPHTISYLHKTKSCWKIYANYPSNHKTLADTIQNKLDKAYSDYVLTHEIENAMEQS